MWPSDSSCPTSLQIQNDPDLLTPTSVHTAPWSPEICFLNISVSLQVCLKNAWKEPWSQGAPPSPPLGDTPESWRNRAAWELTAKQCEDSSLSLVLNPQAGLQSNTAWEPMLLTWARGSGCGRRMESETAPCHVQNLPSSRSVSVHQIWSLAPSSLERIICRRQLSPRGNRWCSSQTPWLTRHARARPHSCKVTMSGQSHLLLHAGQEINVLP